MKRRTYLGILGSGGIIASSGIVVSSGVLNRSQEGNRESDVNVEFELVNVEFAVDDPPNVTIDDDTVVVRGTIRYGSTSCGTVDLAHAGYESSQRRLDLLIAAADDSGGDSDCTDDLGESGYRVEVEVTDEPRQIAATEHHVFGEVYSTTIDPVDW